MKKVLAFLADLFRPSLVDSTAFHDDSLRANQGGNRATFSPWRALVGG